MRELDIYVPVKGKDGTPMPGAALESIKESLIYAFGGFTRLRQPIEGVWRAGSVTVHDDVTIFRVLDEQRGTFDILKFKGNLERLLNQEEVLIVAREITVVKS